MAGIQSIYDFFTGNRTSPGTLGPSILVGGTNGTYTKSGENISTDNALKEAIVLSCVNVIAQGIAQLPIEVRRTKDDERVDNHITRLLRRPNAYQTPYDFKYSIVSTLLVYGQVFLHIKRRTDGTPIAVVPMDPTEVSLSSNSVGLPVYLHQSEVMLDPKDIIHIKDVSTFEVGGKSRVEQAAELLGAYKAANRLMSETFDGGINVQSVISSPLLKDAETAQKWSDAAANTFGKGKSRSGGWMAVPGDAKVSQLKGSTPADADLRNLRKDLINEIAALFRVPAFLVGGSGDEKYSNVRQKQTSLYRDTFAPIITSIEEALMLKLMGNNADTIRFNVDELLRGDQESQMRISVQGVTAGIITPNEARYHLGMEELDGGDELRDPTETTERIDSGGSNDQPNDMNPESKGDNDEEG